MKIKEQGHRDVTSVIPAVLFSDEMSKTRTHAHTKVHGDFTH